MVIQLASCNNMGSSIAPGHASLVHLYMHDVSPHEPREMHELHKFHNSLI